MKYRILGITCGVVVLGFCLASTGAQAATVDVTPNVVGEPVANTNYDVLVTWESGDADIYYFDVAVTSGKCDRLTVSTGESNWNCVCDDDYSRFRCKTSTAPLKSTNSDMTAVVKLTDANERSNTTAKGKAKDSSQSDVGTSGEAVPTVIDEGPAVSTVGMVVLVVLVLAAMTVVLGRRQRSREA